MREQNLKAKLIDYLLLQRRDEAIISCEVPFADGRRRADLISIGEACTAYEIKGDLDNLDKLSGQIKDYQDCFEKLVVVTTPKHIKSVKAEVPRSVGIIAFEGGAFGVVRNPIRRRMLRKYPLVSLVTRDELVEVVRNYGTQRTRLGRDVASLRRHLADKATVDELRQMAYRSLFKRSLPKYEAFMKNRGQVTHPDDLYFLTNSPPAVLRSFMEGHQSSFW
ncbi:MAG: sce7726 family protein [Aquisalimonadaceae bacterium]